MKGIKMEDKIEAGEYIRTKAGCIYKITEIDENGLVYFENSCSGWNMEQLDTIIKKHSKNIIDLIEDGDLVNTYVCRKYNGKMCNYDLNTRKWEPLEDLDIIETILTHEIYDECCYKIGGQGERN